MVAPRGERAIAYHSLEEAVMVYEDHLRCALDVRWRQ